MNQFVMADLLPHGYCLQWRSGLVGTTVLADAAIALAYFSIPSLLFVFKKRRPDVEQNWVFVAFGLFILACGTTHVMDIVTLWAPMYYLAAFFKVVTAIISVATAAALFRLMPGILQIPTPNQLKAVKEEESALIEAKYELQNMVGRLQATFESAAIGLSHTGPDGRFLMVNKELCRMLGYTPAELIQMNAADLSHPDDFEETRTLALSVLNGERESYSVEKRYIHKRSMAVWVEVTASLVRNSEGEPGYFVVATRDISKQKESSALFRKTMEKLQHREKQMAMLFEQGGVGDFSWNIERDLVTAHPTVWNLYGANSQERGPQSGAWFEQRQHPDDLPLIRDHFKKVLETSSVNLDIEFRVVQPDHSVRWVACRGRVVRDANGKPTEIYGLNIDISRLKLAQQEVRESEARLTALMDVMPQLAWFNNAAGDVEFLNDQWYEYTGQNKSESLSWGWKAAIHPQDLNNLINRWTHALNTGLPHEAEFRVKAKDGSYRWHLGRGRPLRNADGKIVQWVGTCTDIEERKSSEVRLLSFSQEMERRVAERTNDLQAANQQLVQARAGLIEAQGLLEKRLTELAETNQELGRKNEEVEAFVYIVSHDLRTPLVNLQGFSNELSLSCQDLKESLVTSMLSQPQRERIETILAEDIPGSLRFISASTAKFERLINALLELSRHGRHEYRREELDLRALLQATLDSMQHSISASASQMHIGAMPHAYGDATAVGQVFSNLIGNSIKYLHPGRPGKIEIGGQIEDSTAHCWVRDNGSGLPAGARSRLLQVFQRFHPELAEGEGMGLAVVKRIVERHGGRIWAEGEEGVGSTFHFTLPRG